MSAPSSGQGPIDSRDAGRPGTRATPAGPDERRRPFDAIRARLAPSHDISHDHDVSGGGDGVRLDVRRQDRTGVPEIVLAGTKPAEVVVTALVALATTNGRAMASRCAAVHLEALESGLPDGFRVEPHPDAGAAVVVGERHDRAEVRLTGGAIGVLTAGSSDARAAAEAALVATEMGCRVHQAADVGVAGLHRLVEPLEAMIDAGIDALVVAAGMDGALPSVVAGLVDVPVIGLPTSVGYGLGGAGEGAILAMLQSCAPGLVVVNVDNGIGAGAAAARIANRAASARSFGRRDTATADQGSGTGSGI